MSAFILPRFIGRLKSKRLLVANGTDQLNGITAGKVTCHYLVTINLRFNLISLHLDNRRRCLGQLNWPLRLQLVVLARKYQGLSNLLWLWGFIYTGTKIGPLLIFLSSSLKVDYSLTEDSL